MAGRWRTVENNHVQLTGCLGETASFRVVWQEGGIDVAYVVPSSDGNNGNDSARLIAAAPCLLDAVNAVMEAYSPFQQDKHAMRKALSKCIDAALKAGSVWRPAST